MKKLILEAFVFCFVFKSVCAQKIIKHIDTMNDKVYFFTDKRLALVNKEQKKGFALDLFITTYGEHSDNDISPIIEGLTTSSVNIGTCNENDELIIQFDDDSKIKLISFNEFNCEGRSYYRLDPIEYDALKSKKIKRFVLYRKYN